MKAITLSYLERIPNTRLSYIDDITRVNPKRRRARFLCDCGNEIETDLNWVRFLNITSCGCYKSEIVSEKNRKHDQANRKSKTGAYRSWAAMHNRVKLNPLYEKILICDRWCGNNGFENFFADMGSRPVGFTIERKDNNKGYEPSNCIWADKFTQAQNSSNAKPITINDETKTIIEWCRYFGMSYTTFKDRVRKGMSIEIAITTPLNLSKRRNRHA